nr:inaD-like protein [Rhipicephalus microplus]
MTNKENYKIADADALFDAVQLYIDSTPPCDQNRLSPRHAVLPRGMSALSTVQDFVETTIVLRKERNELGISITGGSDTYLVNELSLRDVCSTDAVRALREAPSPVRLMVLRENPQTLFTTTEKPSKFITVEMRKGSVKDRLGISFIQRTNGRGVFITYIQPGSIAARHGRRVMQGDQILEINGTNVRESNQKDVAQMINNLDGAIVLLLGRVPSLSTTIQEWARKKAQQSLRTRTSTWSSYTGNNKEKLQIQRPSLPLSSESYVVSLGNCVTSMLVATSSPSGPASRSREVSPSSSLRRSRLSIVAEDVRPSSGVTRTTSLDDAAAPSASGVPSIMVTSC